MDAKTIGQRMKARREFLGLSLRSAGIKMGASAASLRRWENGEIASLKTTRPQEIADALYTTPAYLLGVEEQPAPPKQEEDQLDLPYSYDFKARAKGDAMINARIYDGDLVLVKSQSSVENGELAAIALEGSIIIRRFYQYPKRIELRPENPTYEVMNFEGTEAAQVKILGKVVGIIGEVE